MTHVEHIEYGMARTIWWTAYDCIRTYIARGRKYCPMDGEDKYFRGGKEPPKGH